MTALANCYLSGEGVAKEGKQAVVLLQQAADKGNARAKNLLGRCYHKCLGTKPTEAMARTWFQKAAEGGHSEAIQWCKANNVSVKTAR